MKTINGMTILSGRDIQRMERERKEERVRNECRGVELVAMAEATQERPKLTWQKNLK